LAEFVTTAVPEYRLSVERTLENRIQLGDFQDESSLAWEQHRRRATVLHELLADDAEWRVTDWGDTGDESRTHELVHLSLEWLQSMGPGVGAFVALHFGDTALTAVEERALTGIRQLVNRLVRRQLNEEVGHFALYLPRNAGYMTHVHPRRVLRPCVMFGGTWVEMPVTEFSEEH
jgi:hypothetical protein